MCELDSNKSRVRNALWCQDVQGTKPQTLIILNLQAPSLPVPLPTYTQASSLAGVRLQASFRVSRTMLQVQGWNLASGVGTNLENSSMCTFPVREQTEKGDGPQPTLETSLIGVY